MARERESRRGVIKLTKKRQKKIQATEKINNKNCVTKNMMSKPMR